MDDEEHSENFYYESGPFTDPEGLLPLSPKQASRLGGWKRPSQLSTAPQMVKVISPFQIEQDLVGDCSFICSLCICAAYERRFNKRLITNIIYPKKDGAPIYNPRCVSVLFLPFLK